MSSDWSPLTRERLPHRLATWLAAEPGIIRVAIDGPPCADPAALAESLIEPLHALSRPAAHVRASSFWRDASVRLEHGHEDVESYRSWLDTEALRREVLLPAVEAGSYLPSLRDPETDRSTRESPRPIAPDTVLIVSGSLLLGLGLPFDHTIHLLMSPSARARRTRPDVAWTLPAYDEYDSTVAPAEVADVAIRVDRRNPAVRGLTDQSRESS